VCNSVQQCATVCNSVQQCVTVLLICHGIGEANGHVARNPQGIRGDPEAAQNGTL